MNQLTFDGFLFYVFWGSVLLVVIGMFDMIGEWITRKRGKR